MEKFLIVKSSGGSGLGDKLRALASAIVYARWSCRTLYVDWNDPAYGDGIDNYFQDLFRLEDIQSVSSRPLSDSVRPAAWRSRLHLNLDQIYEEFGGPPWNYPWARDLFSFDQGVQDWDETICVMFDFPQFKYLVPYLPGLYPSIRGDESEEWMQGEILRRHVKPSAVLKAALDPWLMRLEPLRPVVGVHVRASDEHFKARAAPSVATHIQAVRSAMRKSGAQSIFLATDNRAVQDLFVRKFGSRRVIWTDKWLPEPGGSIHLDGTCPDRTQAARDALLDILLLASADALVSFQSSSFSIVARMLSKIPATRRITLAAKLPLGPRVLAKMRTYAGVLTIDTPRLMRCLLTWNGWMSMRNRDERLTANPAGLGVKCEGEYSRPLHICNVFPATGRWLLHRALRQWPINLGPCVQSSSQFHPNVSFIIGQRGLERLPLLLLTLAAIRNQRDAAIECIVVEQDENPQIQSRLPTWVRYLHAPVSPAASYSRSAAFNAGARLAEGAVLVLHDNDLLVPQGYAAECWRRYREGFEVSQLLRFIFYLDQQSTSKLISEKTDIRDSSVEKVIENAAGGSLAISRSAFEEIGGMDEEFCGWGGEDNEFLDRCMTRTIWRWGHLPAVHLWHRTVADRSADNPSLKLWRQKQQIPPLKRISSLLVSKNPETGTLQRPANEAADAHHS